MPDKSKKTKFPWRSFLRDPDKIDLLESWLSLRHATKRLETGNYDIKLASGLHRVKVPIKRLDPASIKKMGFIESYIAVPERGQKSYITYRNPINNLHIHKHKDNWYIHKDKFMPLQIALNKILAKGPAGQIGAVGSGIGHVVFEGIPGFYSYISRILSGAPTFKERLDWGRDKTDVAEKLKDLD